MEKSLAILPPGEELIIGLHPNDVLVASDEEMRKKFQYIHTCCHNRKYQISTSGLTPITPNPEDYIRAIRTWNRVAREVLDPIRAVI